MAEDSLGVVIGIDDDKNFLNLMKKQFESYNCEFKSITDPDFLLDLVEENIDSLLCIVSDYNMPKINGIELAKNVIKLYKNVPIILASGFISLEDANKMMKNDLSGFVGKPVSKDEIDEVFEYVIKPRKEDLDEKKSLSKSFFEESENIYEDIENTFADYNQEFSEEFLVGLFRFVHTLKGSSGILERPHFTNYLHKAENYLDFLKSNHYQVDESTCQLLFSCCDFAFKFIDELKQGKAPSELYKIFEEKIDAINDMMETKKYTKWTKKVDTEDPAAIDSKVKKDGTVQVSVELLEKFLLQSSKITMLKNMLDKLAQAILKDFPREKKIYNLVILLDEMNKINSSIQNQIVDLRKIPVNRIFKKVKRIIRDVAFKLNKPIKTEIADNNVRLDPAISEVLTNSLVHLVRNAIDHGIESPEQRLELNKPKDGSVNLEVDETESSISLKISDDGKGIAKDKILDKALKNGLINQEDIKRMDESDIYGLIFNSGLSTAEKVSEISGRGVGLDMVKASIEKYNGRILVNSTEGKGTDFLVSIPKPKSVSIISSLVVEISNSFYAIDQNLIFGIKLLGLCKDQIWVMNNRLFIAVFDKLLPIIDVEALFSRLDRELTLNDDILGKYILFLQEKSVLYSILVDDIVGSEESVINKILPIVNKRNFFKGATFMGDGTIGLVLNVNQIGNVFSSNETRSDGIKVDVNNNENHAFEEVCYLLFDIGYKHKFAILLDDIFRFERFNQKEVENIGNFKQIYYSGKVLNVLDLYELMDLADKKIDKQYGKSFDMMVFKQDHHFIGIPTTEVVGTYNYSGKIKKNITRIDGFLGNFNHSQHGLVTIVDIAVILKEYINRLKSKKVKKPSKVA
ncbi:MAG: ATP-binding protein [Oligoflexales bacterium]